jgi:hypothetical protein
MLAEHVPSPVANAKNKIEHIYSGSLELEDVDDDDNANNSDSDNEDEKKDKTSASSHNNFITSMLTCDPDGPLVIHTTKNYC